MSGRPPAGGTFLPIGLLFGCGVGEIVGFGTGLAAFALLEPVAVAIHFEDVDGMGEAIEQRAGEPLGREHAGPLIERQVGGDDSRTALVALAEHLEQQFGSGLGQRHVAELVENQPLTVGPLAGADGERAYFVRALQSDYSVVAKIGAKLDFSRTAMAETALVRGVVIHNATRSVTGIGTARKIGAIAAGRNLYDALHVLAASGMAPTLDVAVVSSAMADMSIPTTRITFEQKTGLSADWKSVAGAVADTYWRVTVTPAGEAAGREGQGGGVMHKLMAVRQEAWRQMYAPLAEQHSRCTRSCSVTAATTAGRTIIRRSAHSVTRCGESGFGVCDGAARKAVAWAGRNSKLCSHASPCPDRGTLIRGWHEQHDAGCLREEPGAGKPPPRLRDGEAKWPNYLTTIVARCRIREKGKEQYPSMLSSWIAKRHRHLSASKA